MLIIFDLDDTLIDTSGSITPIKLEHALIKMQASGLKLDSFSSSLSLLKRLNELAKTARDALLEFAEMHDIEERYFELGVKELYESDDLDIPIFPLEAALELLAELKNMHQLALVTIGKDLRQREKMKKAGIDSAIFSKIIVTEEKNKKIHYQAIVEELGFAATDVIVCGDKISLDLSPAKELGFKTVHIRFGRGKNNLEPKEDVDYSISSLAEIKNIIK